MNKFLSALGACALLILVTDTASADGVPVVHGSMKDAAPVACCDAQWSGLYIAGSIGYSGASIDVFNEVDDGGLLSSQENDVSSDGATGTIALGYDRMMGGYVFGVFADYTFGDLDGSGTLSAPGFIDPFEMTFEDVWAVGVRFGVVRSCCTLWYVTAGYTQTDMDFDNSFSADGFSEELSGYFVGGGVEQNIRDGWSLKLEYRYSSFQDENVFDFLGACGIGCSESVDVDTEIHSVRLGLSYKLGRHYDVLR